MSCAARPGVAGLGRHLQEIAGALDRRSQPHLCICASSDTRPTASSRGLRLRLATVLGPLGRVSPAWRVWRSGAEFDAYATERLPQADHLIAFDHQALGQFRAARKRRYETVALVSGGVHVRRIARQHARAHRQYPIERSYGTHVARRYLLEYARANRIYVSSRYAWESFLEEGVREDALSLFPLTPALRFTPAPTSASGAFEIVYVGGLSVAKGVPLLVDAVRRLPQAADMRLVLVGGCKSPGMRRFIERACADDPRISAAPGDPLPHLRSARLCVHPSYADGFSYGAAEALACGVPVIASEDTGMKDLIAPGHNGLILPTGDLGSLTESIEAAYRGEILGGPEAVVMPGGDGSRAGSHGDGSSAGSHGDGPCAGSHGDGPCAGSHGDGSSAGSQ
ncbi:MAG TPA: glycosyltransferase [Solirubrobacteraceae bacterium]|nr:glycosyltransferase [Solirubrobacteraceae bacterium]